MRFEAALFGSRDGQSRFDVIRQAKEFLLQLLGEFWIHGDGVGINLKPHQLERGPQFVRHLRGVILQVVEGRF